MNELRDSILSLGVADPETAVAVHAALGGDPADVALAGALPQRIEDVEAWVKANFLTPDSPFFEAAATAAAEALGEEPDEAADKILRDVTIRPRTVYDLRLTTGLTEDDLAAILPVLADAGLVRAEINPLDLDQPFWTIDNRRARFAYAMLGDHVARWRRGRITETLWRMTRPRFERYVCRPEFQRLAREWALNDPAARLTTRITVPDPRFRQMRTLELAVWGEEDRLLALGTVRWRFRMVERQLKRLRHVKRLLGDPPVRLYCVASRFEAAVTADPDPAQFAITSAQLLRRKTASTTVNEAAGEAPAVAAEAPKTAPDGD